MSNFRLEKFKKALLSWPYNLFFILFFMGYIFFNIWINQLYITFNKFFITFSPFYYIPFIFFNLVLPFLAALNINLIIIKFKELNYISNSGGSLSFLGVLGGLIGGACPGCIAGIFPAIMGLIGLSINLSSFPFKGLEIQVLSIVLLTIGLILLTRETKCKIKNKK